MMTRKDFDEEVWRNAVFIDSSALLDAMVRHHDSCMNLISLQLVSSNRDFRVR